MSEFFKTSFSIKSIFSFLLLNHSPFGGHLWYLCALLYTLLFVALLRKFLKNWERILYIITPILLVADLVLGKYSLIIFGCEPVPIIFIRNFFFVGIPFFTIGLFINRHRELFSIIKKHTVILWILVVFFVLTTCLERYILVSLNLNATRDQYISTTLLATVLFLVFDNLAWNERKLGFLKKIGREFSLMIYIIHPIVIPLVRRVLSKIGIFTIYDYLAPILIFAVSLAFSVLYYTVKNLILRKINHKKIS